MIPDSQMMIPKWEWCYWHVQWLAA
jgi:hypothetical protein